MINKTTGFISVLVLILIFITLAFADTVNYTYDDAGRLIKAKNADGKTIEYTYDKAGNLVNRSVTTQAPDKEEEGGGGHHGDGGICFISTISGSDQTNMLIFK